MYKAVFIDLDGTLLSPDHSVSAANQAAIRQAREQGIEVVLVSARPLQGMLSIAGLVGLKEAPLAALNGSLIVQQEEVLFEANIDAEMVAGIHERLVIYQPTLIYYQPAAWYADRQDLHTEKEQKIMDIPLQVQPFVQTLQTWRQEKSGPNKILAVAPEPTAVEMEQKLMEQYAGALNISRSKPIYVEMMNPQASKLAAVQFLMNRMGLLREEVMAIGDNYNDADMIAFAGAGVAMGNAPDPVKSVAAYVTESNRADGVARALKHFIG